MIQDNISHRLEIKGIICPRHITVIFHKFGPVDISERTLILNTKYNGEIRVYNKPDHRNNGTTSVKDEGIRVEMIILVL